MGQLANPGLCQKTAIQFVHVNIQLKSNCYMADSTQNVSVTQV